MMLSGIIHIDPETIEWKRSYGKTPGNNSNALFISKVINKYKAKQMVVKT